MTEKNPFKSTISWVDLTVPNADEIRDFYAEVTGWKPEPVDMGDYHDYNMTDPETGTPVAGVCHRRGQNANIPAQWMIYITVENLENSIAKCIRLGGEVIDGPRGGFCVIRDPAGAVAALFDGMREDH